MVLVQSLNTKGNRGGVGRGRAKASIPRKERRPKIDLALPTSRDFWVAIGLLQARSYRKPWPPKA